MLTAREIVLSFPKRFKGDPLHSYQGVVHFDIDGEDGGQFTVIVKDECTVEEGLVHEPSITVRTSDKVYQAIEYGNKNAMQAILTGDVKVSNMLELMPFTQSFHGLLSKKNKL